MSTPRTYLTLEEIDQAILTLVKARKLVYPDKPKRVSKKQKIAALTQKYIITSRA